jgi:hypothetical protein
MARRRSKKLRCRRQRRSHFGEEDFKPLREGVSFKINDDVKFWNAYSNKDGTVIAYVSNTNVDGSPTKYYIVRLDDKTVNIESSSDFEVWGHFPTNFLPFRQLYNEGDIGVKPERIYILTTEQVKGIYAIVEAHTKQKTRGKNSDDNFHPSQLEIPLLQYLNNNYVLQIVFNKNKKNKNN